MGRRKKTKEQIEYDRLAELYRDIPESNRQLVDGLLVQASRLKASLDALWENIQQNGETEMVIVKGEARTVKRAEAELFTARDKSYQSIIKQLNELLPEKRSTTGFSKMDEDDD